MNQKIITSRRTLEGVLSGILNTIITRREIVVGMMRIVRRGRGLIKAPQWKWEFEAPHIEFSLYFSVKGIYGIFKRLRRGLCVLPCT